MIVKYREVVCDGCKSAIVHLHVGEKPSDYGVKKRKDGKHLCEDCEPKFASQRQGVTNEN